MSVKAQLKEAFDVESKHGAFYTGGNVEWHEDVLYCQTGAGISLLNTNNGLVEKTIGEEAISEDTDFIQTFTSDGSRLISSHKSGLLKLWNSNGEIEKMWKYIHKGPIVKLALKDHVLASGGADGIVRVWDLKYQACLMGLKGCQGVINVVEFHPVQNYIFASGDDGKINCFNLDNKGELVTVYDAHYSKVTSLIFSHDNSHFITCGRDKAIILWEYLNTKPIKTIPTYESVEVIVKLPTKFELPNFKSDTEGIYVASGGESGKIRVWDVKKVKEVYVQSNSLVTPGENGGLSITNLLCNDKNKTLAVITVDHNIIFHHLKSFACTRQFTGFSDEILDVAYVGTNDEFLAVATNSNDIKLYDNSEMSCQLLKGHTDIVLSLQTSRTNPDLMVSCGKDNTVKLWLLEGKTMSCVSTGARHTASVTSATFNQSSASFIISASQDNCIKLWDVPKQFKNQTLNCTKTEIAHQKEINAVAVAPNDRIIASASQDKTAKLWSDKLEFLGTLKGHKRGVWSVRFSPVDQVVLTSSADGTIKLWSVTDLACIKTIEGHDASVLKAEFLNSGLQILSAGGDGLIKLFSIKTSECELTLDQHDAKIWALALKKDDSGFVTGGADSVLIKWKDVTEELREKRVKEAEEVALQDQQLSNYLQSEQYLKALKLALRLDKPFQSLKIVRNIIKKSESGLAQTIQDLPDYQKEQLLKTALTWNMNSKNCQVAQTVLNVLLNELNAGSFRPKGLGDVLEGALPYTERHFKRLTQLMTDMQLINYTINCMQPHAKDM